MKEHIYSINAHPDDLNGCLGLFLMLKDNPNYQLHVIDVTRGERGLQGQGVSLEECARIRLIEETNVCQALGLKQVYLDQVDGEAFAPRETCEMLTEIFRQEPPRAVITHWPVDTHMDHVMTAAIAMKASQQSGTNPEIYFYSQTFQTISMPPVHYFPLPKHILEKKSELLKLYVCQDGDLIAEHDEIENRFHGARCHAYAAEIFGSCQYQCPGRKCFFDEISRNS